MAQYFTDFSEYTLGEIENETSDADWTPRIWWRSTWNISSFGASDQVLEYITGTASTARRLLTWDAVPAVADVEVYAEIPLVDGAWPFSAIALRADPLKNSENSNSDTHTYRVGFYGPNAIVQRYKNGTYTNVSTVAHGIDTAEGTAKVRVKAIGDNFKVRVWAGGDPEPATWDIDVDDASGISEEGLVGAVIFNPSARYLSYGVGTGGDAAPTSSASSSGPDLLLGAIGA